jgi:lipid-A-disaccharide synthase
MDDLRTFLYYPLGFLPSVFFSARFIIQWMQSERLKTSYVNGVFWKLSLAGNILAALHYFIQFQYIFLIIQAGNAFIAWRNLNLMDHSSNRLSTRVTIVILSIFLGLLSLFYFYQLSMNDISTLPDSSISPIWHFIGCFGGFLFASRFWIQWWNAEKQRKSQLNEGFWILSILGGVITIIYSIKINDTISIVNFSCGLVPYIRNLMLLIKAKKQNQTKISGLSN